MSQDRNSNVDSKTRVLTEAELNSVTGGAIATSFLAFQSYGLTFNRLVPLPPSPC
jgi:hypothetical protein